MPGIRQPFGYFDIADVYADLFIFIWTTAELEKQLIELAVFRNAFRHIIDLFSVRPNAQPFLLSLDRYMGRFTVPRMCPCVLVRWTVKIAYVFFIAFQHQVCTVRQW